MGQSQAVWPWGNGKCENSWSKKKTEEDLYVEQLLRI